MPRRYYDAPLKYDLSLEFLHKCGQSRLADWQLVGLVFIGNKKGSKERSVPSWMNCSSTVAASSAMIIIGFLLEGKGDKLSYVGGIEGRYMAGSEKRVRG